MRGFVTKICAALSEIVWLGWSVVFSYDTYDCRFCTRLTLLVDKPHGHAHVSRCCRLEACGTYQTTRWKCEKKRVLYQSSKNKISHAAISRFCWSSIHEWKQPERSTWQLGIHGIVFLCVTGEGRIKLFNSVISLIQFGLKCLVDVLVWIQSIKQKLPLYRKA